MITARSTKTLIISSLVLAAGLFVGAQNLVSAQQSSAGEQVSLTAIPPRLGDDGSLRMSPGEKKQVNIRVSNSSSDTVSVRTTAQDFVVGEDGETPVVIDAADADNRWSLASWLTISPSAQTLNPNQSGQIEVLITVPEDALPGGHYAMITHQPNTSGIDDGENDATSAQTSGVNQRVGTLLYVTVDGPINEQAYIRELNIPNFQEFGPVPFSFKIENASDIHIRPQIGVEIRNFFGQKVDTITTDTKNIFPYTTRDFGGQWERVWGFGRYSAEVIASYGTSGSVVVAKTYFWLIPIKLIIAIISVLLILILGGMSIRRHMMHRKTDQSKRINELETKLQELEAEKLKKFED